MKVFLGIRRSGRAGALLAAGLLGVATGAHGQQESLLVQRTEPIQLQHVAGDQIAADDRATIQSQWDALAQKAEFFGYFVKQPGWSYEQIVSPDTPGFLLLQFQKDLPRGKSEFTAFVGRGGERIWIVPVLYGGANPWHSTLKRKNAWAIFNRVVPPDIAEQAVQPHGDWWTLAITYAAMVGFDPLVLAKTPDSGNYMLAPEPSLVFGKDNILRQVVLSDVHKKSGFRLWTVTFNPKGQVTEAHAYDEPNTPLKSLQNLPEPETVVLHPAPVPQ